MCIRDSHHRDPGDGVPAPAAPTSGTTARDVGESSTPLIRRTVSGAASCATPRPRLIQPSPRPRRCTSSCLACTASRVASRVTGSLRIRSHPAGRPGPQRPGARLICAGIPPGNHLNPPIDGCVEIAPPARPRRVTASGRALIVTATGRRTPGPAPTTRTDVPRERCAPASSHRTTPLSLRDDLPGVTLTRRVAADAATSGRRIANTRHRFR